DKLHEEYPGARAYALGLALSLNHLGAAACDLGDLPAARRSLEKGIRCLRALVDANPPNPEYLRLLGRSYEVLWLTLEKMGLPVKAQPAGEEAVRVRETRATLSTRLDDEEELARALLVLGLRRMRTKGAAAAEAPFRKALQVCERLNKRFATTPKLQ